MGKPLVYIIVVNWNQKDVTLECLESLSGLHYPNYQIVVVDNNSQDGSTQAINDRFPRVEQIYHKENRGSTAGYNAGFRRALSAMADYVLLINNDTYIDPLALDCLVEACEPEDIGLTGPLIYFADYPDKIWSAGAMRSSLTLELKGNHGRGKKFSEIIERDFLTSCALLFKRSVLERVGLMDEDFFVYQEENDYCLRVKRAGFRLLLVPQAKVWHRVSLTSGGSDSPGERYWMAKNTMIYFRKHARTWQWLFILPWRMGNAFKTSIRLTWKRNWKALSAYWNGLRDGVISPIHKKRLYF
jgi:GT2 family glycosyltransferase